MHSKFLLHFVIKWHFVLNLTNFKNNLELKKNLIIKKIIYQNWYIMSYDFTIFFIYINIFFEFKSINYKLDKFF